MEQLWITRLLNAWFAKPVTALLLALHVHPATPQAPISNSVAMEILVAVILLVFGLWLGSSLSIDAPKPWQQAFEVLWTGLEEHSEEMIGHGGSKFINYLMTLTLFIFLANIIGLIPGFESPTQYVTVPLGLAVLSFIYYNAHGLRKHGLLGYLKQFLGPIKLLGPVMFPLEIISHCARVLSLTVRLYANMFAGEMVTAILVALLPITGVIFMGLHVFVALLQAYIFVALTMVYLQGALAEEH